MAEERSPVLKLTTSIPIDGSIDVKFTSKAEVTSGVSEKYQKNWYLYPLNVENVKVVKDGKEIENYSGEVVMFATDKQQEKIKPMLDNKVNNVIRISRTIEETTKNQPFNNFTYELIQEGEKITEPESTQFSSNEEMFKSDYRELYKSGDMDKLSEQDFVETATTEPYNINKLRAIKLFKEMSEELTENKSNTFSTD